MPGRQPVEVAAQQLVQAPVQVQEVIEMPARQPVQAPTRQPVQAPTRQPVQAPEIVTQRWHNTHGQRAQPKQNIFYKKKAQKQTIITPAWYPAPCAPSHTPSYASSHASCIRAYAPPYTGTYGVAYAPTCPPPCPPQYPPPTFNSSYNPYSYYW
ncbi:uncharacterized protein [Linepithema humile]|uniref:uncharacterized protein n=1 Tax=Linepithema humile TaxID=83485 RepID=UPI00351E6FC6